MRDLTEGRMEGLSVVLVFDLVESANWVYTGQPQ